MAILVNPPPFGIGYIQRIAQCMPDHAWVNTVIDGLRGGSIVQLGQVLVSSQGSAVLRAEHLINQLPEFSISHVLRVSYPRRYGQSSEVERRGLAKLAPTETVTDVVRNQ